MSPKIFDASIQLWAESTIKHNISVGMDRVDHINLLSNENSTGVLNTFGKILNKEKHKRTPKEYTVLREQSMVSNMIVMTVYDKYDKAVDMCENIKKEFSEFINSLKKEVKIKM